MYCLCTRCIIVNSVQVRSEFGKFAYTAICMRKCTLWSDNMCVFTRFHSVKNANTQLIWSSATWNGVEIGQCWNCVVLWRPIWKWRPVEIFQYWDIIIYPHIKFWWYRTMLNFWGIVAAILKMVTGRNLSMSGINSGHHYLPIYQILMISDNVEFLRYCDGHFENGDR